MIHDRIAPILFPSGFAAGFWVSLDIYVNYTKSD